MAQITDYATLKTAVSDWVNHDLTTDVGTIIQLGESRLRRDKRLRDPTCRGTWVITQDGDALPADFGRLVSWYYDGGTYFGEIELVTELGRIKRMYGLTTAGVPRYAARHGDRIFYAPEPSTTFSTKMAYVRKLTALSDSNTTNWLLSDHPDIYLAASLAEAEVFLKDPEQAALWETKLDRMLDDFQRMSEAENYGGGRVRRHFRPIG